MKLNVLFTGDMKSGKSTLIQRLDLDIELFNICECECESITDLSKQLERLIWSHLCIVCISSEHDIYERYSVYYEKFQDYNYKIIWCVTKCDLLYSVIYDNRFLYVSALKFISLEFLRSVINGRYNGERIDVEIQNKTNKPKKNKCFIF